MSPPPIQPRSVAFEWQHVDAHHWYDNSAIVSNFFNALSTTFPVGESLFIESVRMHQKEIDSEDLIENIRGFIGQEAEHARAHRRFNAYLKRLGYPVDEMEKLVSRVIDKTVRDHRSNRVYLATTCALEHFTTILAQQILRNPRFSESTTEPFRSLWCWHAVEELEHKSVAYDTYESVYGNRRFRCKIMFDVSIVISILVMILLYRYQRADRRHLKLLDWLSGFTTMFIKPGYFWRILPDYLAYYRKDYHPERFDDQQLLESYRQRLGLSQAGETSGFLKESTR